MIKTMLLFHNKNNNLIINIKLNFNELKKWVKKYDKDLN